MADNIGALLGLYSDPKTDPAALAHQLRGQQEMGNFYGLSTIGQVADYGKSLRNTALKTAGSTGKARTAAEKRAYDRAYATARAEVGDKQWGDTHRLAKSRAAQSNTRANAAEARAARKAKEDRNAYSDTKWLVNPETGEKLIISKNSAGRWEDEQGNPVTGETVRNFREIAKPSGKLGSGGERRADAAEARKARKDEEDRNKFTDPKRYINKETGEKIITYSNSAGRRVDSEGDQIRGADLKGFTEVVKPSTRSGGFGARKSTDEFGNPTLIISDGKGGYRTVYASDPSQEVDPVLGKAMAETSASATGREALSKAAMKERGTKAIPAARTARSRIRSTEGAYRNVLNAVREGQPLTGTLINKLGVTLRDVTAQVEQGRAQAGLAGISEHTFGSLSEGERQWLLDTAININKDPKLIVLDMEKKLKGLELLREAKDLEMRELRRGTPDEVIAEMVDDVYGDFTFEDATVGGEDPAAAAARIESGGSLNAPPAVSQDRAAELKAKYGG